MNSQWILTGTLINTEEQFLSHFQIFPPSALWMNMMLPQLLLSVANREDSFIKELFTKSEKKVKKYTFFPLMLAILGRADWPATAMTIYRIMAVTCYSIQHDHVFAWIPVNGRNSSFWLTFWCLLWKIIHFLWAQKLPSIPPSTSLPSRPAACISSENNYMNMPSLLNIFSFSEIDCSGVHLALCIAGMSALFLHHLICNTAQLRDMSL